MRSGILVVFVLYCATSFSQDLKLREEAVRLLEHANAVSTSPKLPNLERVDTFQVFSGSEAKEGSFTRVVIQGVGRREEVKLGDYDLVNVWAAKKVAAKGSAKILPPDLMDVVRITPIYLVRFDNEDVIHTITERSVGGRAARCIQFDTVQGEKTDNNELCVDVANGTLVFEKVGREVVENSEFFPFAGALFPSKISYSSAGMYKIEISQTMTELGPADANVLAPPPNSSLHTICTTFRRPFGISMPQPQPGNGGTTADVLIRARVGVDGRIDEPVVQSSERADLDSEALDLARKWTFTPAMCDGRSNPQEVSFTLHFQGR